MLKKNGPQLSHFLLIYNLVLHVCREARPRGLTGVWTLRQLEDIKRHEVLLNKFIFNTYRAFFYKSKFYEFFFSYRCINSLFFFYAFVLIYVVVCGLGHLVIGVFGKSKKVTFFAI